jgi:hypothetical protein
MVQTAASDKSPKRAVLTSYGGDSKKAATARDDQRSGKGRSHRGRRAHGHTTGVGFPRRSERTGS